jgi:hypothetical protein
LASLSKAIDEVPVHIPYNKTPTQTLLEKLRAESFDSPEIAYRGHNPHRTGFTKRNPWESPLSVSVLASVLMRGVSSWSRKIYRSNESVKFYLDTGYDMVVYQIAHPDNSCSVMVTYLVAKRDFFAAYGFDDARPRHLEQVILVSEGLNKAPIMVNVSHPGPKIGWTAEDPQVAALVRETLNIEPTFLNAGLVHRLLDIPEVIAAPIKPQTP